MSDRRSQIPIRKKSRKISVIRPSKYEAAGAIHTNKDFWKLKLDASKDTNELSESKILAKALPPDLYKKVCDTLNIPVTPLNTLDDKKYDRTDEDQRHIVKNPYLSFRYPLLIERELESDTDVELSPRRIENKPNVHLELLSRPEREQITWPTRYLLPEREDEKTLVKRADDLTNRIAEEFCEYMKQLGGDQQSKLFTPKTIKELFQIEFDTHCARGLCIVPKELHNIPEKTANVTGNTQLAPFSILEREISKDIKAESSPDRVQGFGSSLPKSQHWRAPRNDTGALWRSSKHVPKDLVTLKTVWDGITNLKSVKEYCRWMIEHPEHRRAPYLTSLGLFDSAVLDARLTFEYGQEPQILPTSSPDDEECRPIECIRRRLSQLTDD